MKLIDLLSYIPDECEIGLVRFNGGFSISQVYLWVLGFFMACEDAGLRG